MEVARTAAQTGDGRIRPTFVCYYNHPWKSNFQSFLWCAFYTSYWWL